MDASIFGNCMTGRTAPGPSTSTRPDSHSLFAQTSGFTLVELSIVLVIIGLLISGLLVGQSMIQAVRTQAFTRQIQQIDIAVSNFRTKYNHLPGDSPYHSAPGDGDGWIENSTTDGATSGSSTGSYDEEIANFWVHLQQDGFLQNEYGTFSADASSGLDVGTHMPHATGASDNAGIIAYLNRDFVNDRNEYWVCDFSPTTNKTIDSQHKRNSAFTSAQALAIDVKMDDGITGKVGLNNYNGIIRASNSADGIAGGATGRCWDASAQNTYLTNNNLECCMMITILSQQGGQ